MATHAAEAAAPAAATATTPAPALAPAGAVTLRWQRHEHQLFLQGLRKYGNRWVLVSREFLPHRTPKQVRSHAQKYFKRLERAPLAKRTRSNTGITPARGSVIGPPAPAATAATAAAAAHDSDADDDTDWWMSDSDEGGGKEHEAGASSAAIAEPHAAAASSPPSPLRTRMRVQRSQPALAGNTGAAAAADDTTARQPPATVPSSAQRPVPASGGDSGAVSGVPIAGVKRSRKQRDAPHSTAARTALPAAVWEAEDQADDDPWADDDRGILAVQELLDDAPAGDGTGSEGGDDGGRQPVWPGGSGGDGGEYDELAALGDGDGDDIHLEGIDVVPSALEGDAGIPEVRPAARTPGVTLGSGPTLSMTPSAIRSRELRQQGYDKGRERLKRKRDAKERARLRRQAARNMLVAAQAKSAAGLTTGSKVALGPSWSWMEPAPAAARPEMPSHHVPATTTAPRSATVPALPRTSSALGVAARSATAPAAFHGAATSVAATASAVASRGLGGGQHPAPHYRALAPPMRHDDGAGHGAEPPTSSQPLVYMYPGDAEDTAQSAYYHSTHHTRMPAMEADEAAHTGMTAPRHSTAMTMMTTEAGAGGYSYAPPPPMMYGVMPPVPYAAPLHHMAAHATPIPTIMPSHAMAGPFHALMYPQPSAPLGYGAMPMHAAAVTGYAAGMPQYGYPPLAGHMPYVAHHPQVQIPVSLRADSAATAGTDTQRPLASDACDSRATSPRSHSDQLSHAAASEMPTSPGSSGQPHATAAPAPRSHDDERWAAGDAGPPVTASAVTEPPTHDDAAAAAAMPTATGTIEPAMLSAPQQQQLSYYVGAGAAPGLMMQPAFFGGYTRMPMHFMAPPMAGGMPPHVMMPIIMAPHPHQVPFHGGYLQPQYPGTAPHQPWMGHGYMGGASALGTSSIMTQTIPGAAAPPVSHAWA